MTSHNYFKKGLNLDSEVRVLIKAILSGDCYGMTSCEKVVLSFSHNVPPVLQNGPICGLVSIVMGVLLQHQKLKTLLEVPQIGDRLHPQTLLDYAIQCGLSKQGEMFSFDTMKHIVENHLLYQAKVVSTETPDTVRDLLDAVLSGQSSVLVPYDADKNHTPCLARGHRAHWCLLVGVCLILDPIGQSASLVSSLLECCQRTACDIINHYTINQESIKEFFDYHTLNRLLYDNQVYVFARHGKSSHLGLWSLRELLESNRNLIEVDPKRSNPSEYVIPEGGLEQTLKGKMLMITV